MKEAAMTRRALAVSLIALLCSLPLTACGPTREQEDARLMNACVTVVKGLYEADDVIDVKEKTFSSEKSPEGTSLRNVKIHAYYTHNRGAIEEKDYVCAFEETSGLFGYNPHFYRLDKAGVKYGNFSGTIEGDLQDMIKINDAMVAALH
jgi:hypothetical protein